MEDIPTDSILLFRKVLHQHSFQASTSYMWAVLDRNNGERPTGVNPFIKI